MSKEYSIYFSEKRWLLWVLPTVLIGLIVYGMVSFMLYFKCKRMIAEKKKATANLNLNASGNSDANQKKMNQLATKRVIYLIRINPII